MKKEQRDIVKKILDYNKREIKELDNGTLAIYLTRKESLETAKAIYTEWLTQSMEDNFASWLNKQLKKEGK